MSKVQPSLDERRRLAEINALDLEAARPAFERIARLTQCLSRTPMVHISLVQSDTLWLAGVSDQQFPVIPREHSFSDTVIRSGELLWVADLSKDRRFHRNPYVVGGAPFRFRFYAGAPIRLSNGRCVGSLSIIDRKPRPYDAFMAERLTDFAALVADDWERRRVLSAVTEREAEVRSVNATLATVIESAPVALAMTDRNLKVLRASRQWRDRVADWMDGDVIGRPLSEIAPDATMTWDTIRECCMAGESLRNDRARFVSPDGVARWVRWEICPWTDRKGAFGGVLVMVHEISDVVEALEASERAQQRLRLAAEMAEINVWELDFRSEQLRTDGAISLYNPGDRDFQEISDKIWSTVHPAERPEVVAAWERHIREGAPFRAVHRLTQRNGPHVWVANAAEAIRGPDGQIERVVGVTKNIDREKRAERAMAKALDAAEAANKAKNEFLANMSHEIRTPLNGVLGLAGALSRTGLDTEQREMVGLIEGSAGLLDSLLSDVLDIARIESGRLELASEPFELADAVRTAASLFAPKAAEKGLSLDVAIAPGAETLVRGDVVRVRQIVSNLLSNAVKFTDAGAITVAVEADRTLEAVHLRLTVRDTGVGFDAKTGARLFRRFEQGDGSITRRVGGAGLGLAICRSLAEAMGGSLAAESEPGKGAAFTLALALPRERAQLSTSGRPQIPTSLPEAITDAPRVLLAEDHPTNRKVVSLILEAVGVDLTVVENGEQAVDAAKREAFDVILMDMQMPVMDGLTAIRLIREHEKATGAARTPILALTANAMPEHAAASADAGADDHLSKPITAATLVEAVRRAALADARPATPSSLAS